MKKIIFLTTLFLLTSHIGPAHAVLNRETLRATIMPGDLKKTVQERAKAAFELRKNATPTAEAVRQKLNEQKKNIMDQLKDKIKATTTRRFHGVLTAISGSALTVATSNGDITVYVAGDTLLKRRFGANSALSEFATGDELAIVGKRRADNESEIDAKYIRNLSIQRRNTVFSGSITALNAGDNSFTIKTLNRGEQTVYVNSDTVITDKNKTIAFADLLIADKLIVKGELWDRANTKIDAKRIMRLPKKPGAILTPSPSPTSATP